MANQKAQPYPATKIKIGAALYLASSTTDDSRKTSSEIEEWVVRSIRAKRGSKSRFGVAARGTQDAEQYVNLTRKLEYVTWGKRSSKAGDYGWLNSIPDWCTKQFKVGSDLPSGVYTTHRAALVYAIAEIEADIARYKGYMAEETIPAEIAEWRCLIADLDAQMAALKRRLAKLSSK